MKSSEPNIINPQINTENHEIKDAFKKKVHMEGHCPNQGGRG